MEKTKKYRLFVNAEYIYFSTEEDMIDLAKFLLSKGLGVDLKVEVHKTE